jgi:hypothetical protein
VREQQLCNHGNLNFAAMVTSVAGGLIYQGPHNRRAPACKLPAPQVNCFAFRPYMPKPATGHDPEPVPDRHIFQWCRPSYRRNAFSRCRDDKCEEFQLEDMKGRDKWERSIELCVVVWAGFI